jgi:hypothetical protein
MLSFELHIFVMLCLHYSAIYIYFIFFEGGGPCVIEMGGHKEQHFCIKFFCKLGMCVANLTNC